MSWISHGRGVEIFMQNSNTPKPHNSYTAERLESAILFSRMTIENRELNIGQIPEANPANVQFSIMSLSRRILDAGHTRLASVSLTISTRGASFDLTPINPYAMRRWD